MHLSEGGWTLRWGGGSRYWCGSHVVCGQFVSAACCRCPGRAASQLDRDRCYVMMAVLQGGVGGLRWAWRSSWMSRRRPRKFDSVEGIDFVSCGRQGLLSGMGGRPAGLDECVIRCIVGAFGPLVCCCLSRFGPGCVGFRPPSSN
jgi:hypothetical protein